MLSREVSKVFGFHNFLYLLLGCPNNNVTTLPFPANLLSRPTVLGKSGSLGNVTGLFIGCGVAAADVIGFGAFGPFQETDGWLSVVRFYPFARAIGIIIVSTMTYSKLFPQTASSSVDL